AWECRGSYFYTSVFALGHKTVVMPSGRGVSEWPVVYSALAIFSFGIVVGLSNEHAAGRCPIFSYRFGRDQLSIMHKSARIDLGILRCAPTHYTLVLVAWSGPVSRR